MSIATFFAVADIASDGYETDSSVLVGSLFPRLRRPHTRRSRNFSELFSPISQKLDQTQPVASGMASGNGGRPAQTGQNSSPCCCGTYSTRAPCSGGALVVPRSPRGSQTTAQHHCGRPLLPFLPPLCLALPPAECTGDTERHRTTDTGEDGQGDRQGDRETDKTAQGGRRRCCCSRAPAQHWCTAQRERPRDPERARAR